MEPIRINLEALQEMWNKLSREGMISLSCWMDYPVEMLTVFIHHQPSS